MAQAQRRRQNKFVQFNFFCLKNHHDSPFLRLINLNFEPVSSRGRIFGRFKFCAVEKSCEQTVIFALKRTQIRPFFEFCFSHKVYGIFLQKYPVPALYRYTYVFFFIYRCCEWTNCFANDLTELLGTGMSGVGNTVFDENTPVNVCFVVSGEFGHRERAV
jgi:hypothetical protein